MSGANQHRARYKNAALDSQEMRRRREEEGIQLRKQKREQQLFKKRNVNADESVQVTFKNPKHDQFVAESGSQTYKTGPQDPLQGVPNIGFQNNQVELRALAYSR